jgi:hypothetical protein
MPRVRREDFAGVWHHVMHRGVRRAPVFADDADCLGFLDALAERLGREGRPLRHRTGQAREPLEGWKSTWLACEEKMKYKGV